MFGQTFDLIDIFRILCLAFLEILFSADNAIVLSLITRSLPSHDRQKALFIGFFSALMFRMMAIVSIFWLLQFQWIQIVGALYLLYVSVRHFFHKGEPSFSQSRGFWKTVFLIEMFDLLFAFDSIIAALAFIGSIPSSPSTHPKLWIVFVGALLGMIVIRFAAKWIGDLIERFPRLEKTGYLMIGWIGLKLLINSTVSGLSFEPIFWPVLAILVILGFRHK